MLTQMTARSYIFAPVFRNKMSTFWSIPEVQDEWVPQNDTYPRIVQDIRSFVDDRAMQPRDSPSADLKEMRGIFSAMKLGEDDDRASPSISAGADLKEEMDLDGFVMDGNPHTVNTELEGHDPVVFSDAIWNVHQPGDQMSFLDPALA